MLSAESICVSYNQRPVLKDISFELKPGEILTLIGPNGVGKSTLIRALSGVIPLASGRVIIDNRDVTHTDPLERARLMAFVPQALNLPPAFTAWETVLLGRTPHLNWLGQTSTRDEVIARRAMERTHTLALAQRRVGEVSGGEQQRLLLARALAQSTPILIMDEPTAHLDLHYQISLLDEVRNLARNDGLAVLIALHDLNMVSRYADRVGLLLNGKLHAIGKPAEVLTPALLSQAYQVPLQVIHSGNGSTPLIAPAH
jgi:iron complex transport system ATP-binding protein